MSAYITQLDILGFNGSVAAWTSKVNTVEEGGGGGGAMSASCFTLSTSSSNEEWTQTETAKFLSDRIKLNKEVLNVGITFYLTMTVTSEFSGLFPESITLHYSGDDFAGAGVQQFDFAVDTLDSNGDSLAQTSLSYGSGYSEFDPPLDTEFTLSLVYPEGSSGFYKIVITDSSPSWT